MTKRVRFSFALLAATVAAFVLSTPVWTYYDDTHYSFTYFMARECGYTPMQAHRLASANVAIDYSAPTEPVQGGRVGDGIVGFVTPEVVRSVWDSAVSTVTLDTMRSEATLAKGSVMTEAQEPRVRFHAFRDHRVYAKKSRVDADKAIVEQEVVLERAAKRQRNPGVYLHFVQDKNPHHGFTSWGGHWLGQPTDKLQDDDLRFGATTDFLSADVNRAQGMVRDTMNYLATFMRFSSTKQRAENCDPDRVAQVLNALFQANSPGSQFDQYKARVQGFVPPLTLVTSAPTTTPAPDASVADLAVYKFLQTELVAYPSLDHRIAYEFDGAGGVSNVPAGLVSGSLDDLSSTVVPLDGFTLFGRLNVRLQGAGADGGSKVVSVWAAPTRSAGPGSEPYLLDCNDTGIREFPDLPVGNLIVQTVSNGTVAKKPVTLTRQVQSVTVTMPRDAEVTSECGTPARRVPAVTSCAALRTVEQDFRPMATANAETCRASLPFTATPATAPPPPVVNTPVTTPPPVTSKPKATPPPPSPPPASVQQPKSGGPSAAQLMTGLALAGVGGYALGKVLIELTKTKCTMREPDIPSIFDPNYNSKFAQYKSDMGAWCRCNHFSGFSGGQCVK